MRSLQPPFQDPVNFSHLFTNTQKTIFRYIYGIHGGPIEEVEDITCETYIRAWKGRNHFWGDEHDALCWLFTIARHLVIDTHRRKKVHPDSMYSPLDFDIDCMNFSNQTNPEDQAYDTEQFRQLWKIIQNLPGDKREVLILRFMLGWKVKEIAQFLHKQENTVSVTIRRCLEQIRHDWEIN